VSPEVSPEELVVTMKGTTHRLKYHPGDTLLDTMLIGGLAAPFLCREGACATCMVRCLKGKVVLLSNQVLTDRDLADGYTLACQGVPVGDVCEIELAG
jgi:3-ketosteroid 9alpha-monooxygenase subunit B